MGFAQAGARVGLLARSQAELDLAKMEIEHAGGNALRLRADVRDLEQMTAAVDRMLADLRLARCAGGGGGRSRAYRAAAFHQAQGVE